MTLYLPSCQGRRPDNKRVFNPITKETADLLTFSHVHPHRQPGQSGGPKLPPTFLTILPPALLTAAVSAYGNFPKEHLHLAR